MPDPNIFVKKFFFEKILCHLSILFGMKRTENLKVIEAIIIVFERLKDSHFEDEALGALYQELEMLANYLHCSQVQAALFTIVFGLQYKTSSEVNFSMVVEYLDENGLYLLKYIHDINILVEKELLVSKNNQGKSFYEVEKSVFENIIENEPLNQNLAERNSQEIISEIYDLIMRFKNRAIIILEYNRRLSALEKKYSENEIIRNVVSAYPDGFAERVLLYSLCYRVINGSDYQDEDAETEGTGFSYKIVPNSYSIEFKKQIEDKTHDLFTKGLIATRYDFSGSSVRFKRKPVKFLCLTKDGIDVFFGKENESYEAEIIKCSEQSRLKEFFIEFDEKSGARGGTIAALFSLSQVEKNNEDLKFVKNCRKLIPDSYDRFILYNCCNDFVNLNSSSSLVKTLRDIYGEDVEFSKAVHSYKDEKCFLLREGFLYLEKNENINKSELELSDRTLELIYGKDADLYKNNSSSQDVIGPDSIKEKTLFYSDGILNQLNMLSEALENKNLVAMQKRLEEKALPKGVAVLLYGSPGTGKTESVYQLAKLTNRKIYHVDISQTKSMWFGESEKIIKQVFVKYENLCKTSLRHKENIPILLFNEADAIISKRKSVDSGNTVQTENAIQNIILEQMEKLDGIMIATTNLCDNLDKAFERRFLFKIKFEKPEPFERSKIWKDKINWLSEEEAETVAAEYEFSGGEIDNIVRKCEIEEIISGNIPDFAKIEELCKVEKFSSEKERHIGFCS